MGVTVGVGVGVGEEEEDARTGGSVVCLDLNRPFVFVADLAAINVTRFAPPVWLSP